MKKHKPKSTKTTIWHFDPNIHQTIGTPIWRKPEYKPLPLPPWGERNGRTTECTQGINCVLVSKQSLRKLKYGF